MAVRPVTHEPARDVAHRIVVKGGPIRLGADVYAHANDTHAVIGITDLRVENDDLIISLDHQPGERVVAAVVDEDETISRLGVQAGISGGGAVAKVQLFKDGKKISPHHSMFGTTSNLWVTITVVDPEPGV